MKFTYHKSINFGLLGVQSKAGGVVSAAMIAPCAGGFLRPFLVRLVNCSKFELCGLAFRNPAAWTIQLPNREDATIEKITIHIDSSRRITFRHCKIFSDDDLPEGNTPRTVR